MTVGMRMMTGLALVLAACTVEPDNDGFGAPPVVGPGNTMGGSTGDATGGDASGSGGGGSGTDGADETAGADGPGQTTSSCEGEPGSGLLGGPCTDGCDCASGSCFELAALGTACSECISDTECQQGGGAGTCSVDPLTDPPYAVCTSGELGVMCQPGSSGCQAGLQCAQVIDTMGFLPDYFCSECASSSDCPGTDVCVPVLELGMGISIGLGHLECAPLGSVADGGLCPLVDGVGQASVCTSGTCAVADIGGFGVASIGVCSSCDGDEDCGAGQTCQPPVVDENGAVPATCV